MALICFNVIRSRLKSFFPSSGKTFKLSFIPNIFLSLHQNFKPKERKSPSDEYKSFLDIENLLSVLICARITFELWILSVSFPLSCFFYSKRSDNFPIFFSRFHPSANQLNLSILRVKLCARDYEIR